MVKLPIFFSDLKDTFQKLQLIIMVKNLLVIECTSSYNWYKVFDGATLTSGEKLRVEQASWQEFSCTGYYDSGLIVELQRARCPLPDTPQDKQRTIKPHFVLMRSLCQFLDDSSRNFLYGMQFCNVPIINSLSVYLLSSHSDSM